MINVVNVFFFKGKNVTKWLEPSLQCKGPRFNIFPNSFFQQTKWMKKYIKQVSCLYEASFSRKTKLSVGPKQIALVNNVSSQGAK
jgi:hypothetical protein